MAAKHEIVTPETLPAITWREAKVITTDLLANLYGTTAVRIRQNYSDNERRFEEGKHFFRVAGDELRELKDRVGINDSVVGKRARSLLLWTERGAARHAKMLETDQAWDVFEALEDCYFHRRETSEADDTELSTVKDRHPLYHGAVDIVIVHRLTFGKAYQAMNWYAGVDGFPRMTKRHVKEVTGFLGRFLTGEATQRDFERIEINRASLKGESPQLQLIGVTIPAIYGKK
jgi:hypothetical protein